MTDYIKISNPKKNREKIGKNIKARRNYGNTYQNPEGVRESVNPLDW